MATEITRLEDVRPGDIYLGPIGGWFGPLISAGELMVDGGFHVGPLDVRHIGIVVEQADYVGPELAPPRLAQAMPGGAEIVDMTYAQHWTPKVAYARLPEDYPGQAADAAAIARLMVEHNVAYSFASYGALAAWHWGMSTPKLEKWIGRRQEGMVPVKLPSDRWAEGGLPVEAICSVFADQAWSLTGKKIFTDGRPHQCVTPSQLGQRLLTGLEDVVWGWPIDHPYP